MVPMVTGGCDKNRPVTWRALLVAAAALLVAACGGGADGGGARNGAGTVTGRVMSVVDGRACASPDRGETQTCVDGLGDDDLAGVEVGSCVTVDPEAEAVTVVDEAACAAGDLGDGGGD
jgi:hypothetical protein